MSPLDYKPWLIEDRGSTPKISRDVIYYHKLVPPNHQQPKASAKCPKYSHDTPFWPPRVYTSLSIPMKYVFFVHPQMKLGISSNF